MPLKSKPNTALHTFVQRNKFHTKGPLCVALVITQRARKGLPLDPEKLLAKSGTQVEGLGKSAVQSILEKHGITRVLAEEAGRTSRGSVGNMRRYVAFLNQLPPPVDLGMIERFWIDRVRDFFAGKPFKFRVDAALTIRAAVRDLLLQARARQEQLPGSRCEGAVLQHMIGAKLELILPPNTVTHHSASEADQAEGRSGDFVIGDVAIHATTRSGEALLRKCGENISAGFRPLIITVSGQTAVAEALAEAAGLRDKVEVLDIEQFLAANLHERSLFQPGQRSAKTSELLQHYNRLVEAHETDPSLKIQIAGK